VPGIGIHVVLVSIETLAVLLGPARILVFLPVFPSARWPRLFHWFSTDLSAAYPQTAISKSLKRPRGLLRKMENLSRHSGGDRSRRRVDHKD